ncbi:MAG: glutamine-hydrolyzing GMP synthase, partial [Pacificimonas sp.]
MTVTPAETILVVDFGSQVTQLIARRVREAGVYSEIAPYSKADEAFDRLQPKGIILSGGPDSVTNAGAPGIPQKCLEAGIPVFGICYGQQVMVNQLGGSVQNADMGEFGRAFIDIDEECPLFDGLWSPGERHQVWMSHGDKVDDLPDGFRIVASSDGAPFAVIANDKKRFYGVQFHPEVVHTPDGHKLIANFARHVCGIGEEWTMADF